jgi:hypothetical protein
MTHLKAKGKKLSYAIRGRKRVASDKVSKQEYNLMVESFREFPGSPSRVAEIVGVSVECARRGWRVGWPSRYMGPIKDVIEGEILIARGKRAAELIETKKLVARADDQNKLIKELEEHEEHLRLQAVNEETERLKAKEDAIQSRKEEGKMVSMGRRNTIAVMAATTKLIAGAITKAKEMDEKIKKGKVKLTPAQTIAFVRSCAYVTKTASESAKISMEMERMLMGEPTEIIGLDMKNMSLDDAARTIEMANVALQRAKERGVLTDKASDKDDPTVH